MISRVSFIPSRPPHSPVPAATHKPQSPTSDAPGAPKRPAQSPSPLRLPSLLLGPLCCIATPPAGAAQLRAAEVQNPDPLGRCSTAGRRSTASRRFLCPNDAPRALATRPGDASSEMR